MRGGMCLTALVYWGGVARFQPCAAGQGTKCGKARGVIGVCLFVLARLVSVPVCRADLADGPGGGVLS